MHFTTLLTLALAAVASASSYHHEKAQVVVKLAHKHDVQVLGDGNVNMKGCFNIHDDPDPLKQAGVVHAAVKDHKFTFFLYTAQDCVRATRIFKNTIQKGDFNENPLLARSIRIIDPELMKKQQAAAGQPKGVRWNQRRPASARFSGAASDVEGDGSYYDDEYETDDYEYPTADYYGEEYETYY
ncbi:hypothetical protein PhCBS80983_g06137 [Powellomyces hirtus]|uniref:Uncharacterized protein n=1 Tax=Powellomyces hirtus TaxID=109895 RepID=A0A507DQ73_9FUNG|nr:hypothetical protein PhCBS80983_g06137 [Powellomyces hirtus]